MLRFSKAVLQKVSFDKILFKKELKKSISWLKKEELMMLKIWCLATFGKHKDIILDTFENVI
ncbi:MAG: hypothetical protein CMP75_03680 [Flavobacteriales bacterium]|nr:hypothetical protein [Flavobacteriales bacterium]|tara:strand:+ start:292 stop:477 length:186 start_codon:yes stop_codon:yes gene_type:complete